MKVYISGKIGEEVISEATRRKFAQAEEMLKAKGYEVFNPTDERWQKALKEEYEIQYYDRKKTIPAASQDFYAYCLLRDQMAMAIKDAVYFLSDWHKSPGATSEYHFAKAIKKRMFFQNHSDACENLIERMYAEARDSGQPVEYDGLQDRNDIEIAYFRKHIKEAWLPIDEKKDY